jgi:MHS family proline/betaine transporter-like MFS transporter
VTEPGPDSAPSRPGVLRVVFGSTFLVRFAFGITLSVFASYMTGRSVGIDSAAVGAIGLVSALAPVGEFSTVLLTGSLADRAGRYPVLIGAIAAAAGLMLLISFSRDPFWLGPVNLLFGVASGAILTASLAVVGDESGRLERGYEMGRFDAMNLLGWVLGFAVGFGLLGALPNSSLGLLFDLGAGVLAVGFAYAFLMLRGRAEPPRGSTAPPLSELLRTAFRREVLLVTLPWLVIYLLLGTLFVFLGAASTGAGVPATTLALLIGGGGLLLLLTQPYFGRLADRFGRMRLMTVGTAGFVGVLTGAGLLASFGPVPEILAFVGVSALAALAYGPAALAALTDASLPFSRATTMSVYTLSISLGMLGGLLLSTGLYSRYGAPGLDVYFGLIAVGLVALTAMRYQDTRRAPASPAIAP